MRYPAGAFHRPQGLGSGVKGLMASGMRLALHDGETRCQTRFASENEPARQSGAESCRHARLIALLGDMVGADCLAQFCGERVKRDEVDVEIQFRRQDPTLGLDCYQLHTRCFAVWELERTKIPAASS
jgi:hypothetical protein